MNKSQGEIIKYKQAYENQRERRKEAESKLAKNIDEMKIEAKHNLNQSKLNNKREAHY